MKKIISKILFLSYVAYSIISLSYCTKNGDDTSALDKINHQKSAAIKLLSEKYDAEPFDFKFIKSLVNKSVVIDTTVISLRIKGNDYYLKARIISDSPEKYFAELLCDKEIADQFNHTKTNSLLIAAEIHSISEGSYFINADSLEGKNSYIGEEKVFLIKGNCLALIENSFYADAD